MLGSNRPAAFTPALNTIADSAHIRVVPARLSRRALEAAAARISTQLLLPIARAPVIDDVHNQVVLPDRAATAAPTRKASSPWPRRPALIKSFSWEKVPRARLRGHCQCKGI